MIRNVVSISQEALTQARAFAADSGHADRPFRPMPITRSGKAITRGVTPLP